MADQMTTPKDPPRYLHSEGQFFGRCVDIIDVGEKVKKGQMGKPDKLQRRAAIVFRTGEKNPETGEYVDLSKEFAFSMFKGKGGNAAPLRMLLEQWRGKPYPEADPEVPLHLLEGRPGTIQVAHEKPEGSDKSYANIISVTPVPPGITVPEFGVYTRAPYWADRKERYAKEAAEYRRLNPPAAKMVTPAAAPAAADDDDLPF